MKYWIDNVMYLGLLGIILLLAHLFLSYDYLFVGNESDEMGQLLAPGTFHLVRTNHLEKVDRKFLVLFLSEVSSRHQEPILRAARVIGLPGEEISIVGGKTYINKQPLDESYAQMDPEDSLPPLRVPLRHFFVMVDKRPGTCRAGDSRGWGFLAFELVQGFRAP